MDGRRIAGAGAAGVPVPAGAALTPAEGLVLVVAAVLFVVVFREGAKGALTPLVGVFLLSLAMLAAIAAFLHMVAQ